MKNYIRIGGKFRIKYAYFDNKEHLAEYIFFKHNIPVKFKHDFSSPEIKYEVITCSIWWYDRQKFERALLELQNSMLIRGYNDYIDFYEDFVTSFETACKQKLEE